MHSTAMANCAAFFDVYAAVPGGGSLAIVEIGAQDVNGSLRDVAPAGCSYLGIDFVAGKGVDIVIDDPYRLPLAACRWRRRYGGLKLVLRTFGNVLGSVP